MSTSTIGWLTNLLIHQLDLDHLKQLVKKEKDQLLVVQPTVTMQVNTQPIVHQSEVTPTPMKTIETAKLKFDQK